MKCRSFEKQLYLYREGELNPRERRRLERHLKHCPYCAGEAEAIARSADRIAGLTASDPAAPVPADLTAAVMQGIRGDAELKISCLHLSRRGRIAVVPALAAAALILLVVMTASEALLMHRLTRLESTVTAWTEAVQAGSREYARLAATLERIEPTLRMAGRFSSPAGSYSLVTREELAGLIAGYGLAGDVTPALLHRIREQLPGLAGIDLEDGLDSTEIRMLMQNRNRIAAVLRGL